MAKKQAAVVDDSPVEVAAEIVDAAAEVEAVLDIEAETVSDATSEFLERVQKPVGEETARERYVRVQADAKAFLKSLKAEAKDGDLAAKNKVVSEVILPAFKAIVEAAEEFTGLTVRRLSLRYTNGKDEAPEFKVSHTINKAREDADETTPDAS